MNNRLLLNTGMLVLVGVLVLLVVMEPGLQTDDQQRQLTRLSPEQVSRIRIERHKMPVIMLEKSNGNWRMTSPITVPANRTRVEKLLKITQTGSHARYPVDSLETGKLKLDKPGAVLRLNDTELRFGDVDPLDYHRYVQIGQDVHLITDRFYHLLTGGFHAYISPALLPDNAQISRIRLPDGSTLNQTDAGWQISPARTDLSADDLTALVERWRHAQATDIKNFRDTGQDRYVELTLYGEKEPLRFVLVSDQQELVLGRKKPGIQYHLPLDVGKKLLDPGVPGKETTRETSTPAR